MKKETLNLNGYFAISEAEYNEYQELKKNANSVDYDRLRVGSKVMLKLDKLRDITASTSSAYFKGITYQILIPTSEYQYTKQGGLRYVSNKKYTNLIGEDGSIIHVIGDLKGKVDEVISY